MFLIGIYIILVIASYYNKVNDLYVRTGILLLGIISIFLSVSTSDYPTYEKFFNDIEPLDQIIAGKDQVFLYDFNNFELGYKLLNSFFKTLLPYVEVLYILSNIGIYIAVYFFLRNKAENLYKLILPHFTFFLLQYKPA